MEEKADLLDRLKKAMVDKVLIIDTNASEAPQPGVFQSGAYWEFLTPKSEPVDDPTQGTTFHAPTDANNLKKKCYDYDVNFDCQPFVKLVDVPKFDRFKRRLENGKTVEKVATAEGTPEQSFLDKHGLTHKSRPIELFETFCPMSLTDKWVSFSNRKALLENAGQPGKPYPNWKPFSVKEFRQHIGVRMFHGLLLSLSFDMKFKTQAEDPVNGNDFISRSLGPNVMWGTRIFLTFWPFKIL